MINGVMKRTLRKWYDTLVLRVCQLIAYCEQEVDPNDLDTFNKFLPSGDQDPIFDSGDADEGPGTNLTSLILEKIEAYEAQQAKNQSGGQGAPPEGAVQLPAKAVEVFSKYAMT